MIEGGGGMDGGLWECGDSGMVGGVQELGMAGELAVVLFVRMRVCLFLFLYGVRAPFSAW